MIQSLIDGLVCGSKLAKSRGHKINNALLLKQKWPSISHRKQIDVSVNRHFCSPMNTTFAWKFIFCKPVWILERNFSVLMFGTLRGLCCYCWGVDTAMNLNINNWNVCSTMFRQNGIVFQSLMFQIPPDLIRTRLQLVWTLTECDNNAGVIKLGTDKFVQIKMHRNTNRNGNDVGITELGIDKVFLCRCEQKHQQKWKWCWINWIRHR